MASLPLPIIQAPPNCKRVEHLKRVWQSTLGTDTFQTTEGPEEVASLPSLEAVEHVVSAYAWYGLSENQAYDEVYSFVVSGLCKRPSCSKCVLVRQAWDQDIARYLFD